MRSSERRDSRARCRKLSAQPHARCWRCRSGRRGKYSRRRLNKRCRRSVDRNLVDNKSRHVFRFSRGFADRRTTRIVTEWHAYRPSQDSSLSGGSGSDGEKADGRHGARLRECKRSRDPGEGSSHTRREGYLARTKNCGHAETHRRSPFLKRDDCAVSSRKTYASPTV